MSEDDDRLLDALGAALTPPAAEPSAAELAALHRAVAGDVDAVATVAPMRRRPGNGAWRLALVGAAAAVLLAAVALAPGRSNDPTPLAPPSTTTTAVPVTTVAPAPTTTIVGPTTTAIVPVTPTTLDDKGGEGEDRSGSNSGSG